MLDISENLFQAVDEIVKRRLETVNYDTTIICTIDDNSNAVNNEYICSNGSAKFKAYSADTTFKKDESILVMIPNNDYSQQKIIMGRYVVDDGLPYAHMNPFDNLIDASGNLAKDIIYDENKKYYSLLANENYPEDEEKDKEAREVAVWSKIFDPPLAQFDRLGVQGKFRSWLSALDPKYGSYGYRLEVKSIPERKVDEEPSEKTTNFVLDCSDMFGNPFNFQTFLKQEEVYDITALGNISEMTLYFYQQPGSFRNEANELTPWQDDFNGTPMNKLDNLFTTEPYICLGYDLANFDKEQVILYTINNSTYVFNDKEENLEEKSNKKTVNLRWIHEYDDGIKVVKNLDGIEGYTINWYRHYIGDPPADQYSGVYWRKVNTEENADPFSYTFDPRVDASTEQIKVIIIPPEGKDVITSNILIFTNEDEVVNNATVDMTNGLSIVCQDGSAGNYFIYGQNNNMLDQSQSTRIRKLGAYFGESSVASNTIPSLLAEAIEITWDFPFNNTMISVGGFNYNYKKKLTDNFNYEEKTCIIDGINYYSLFSNIEYDTENEKLKKYTFSVQDVNTIDSKGNLFKLNSNSEYDKDAIFSFDGNRISITRLRQQKENLVEEPKDATDYTIHPYQDYTIKLTYNASALQNDIHCSIKKNNKTYEAVKVLQFGIMGTNGTDTTVVITFDPDQIALTHNKTVDMFRLTANIYDYNHNIVDFTNIDNDHIKIKWEWAENTLNPQKIDIIQKISYNDNDEEILDNSILMNECYLNLDSNLEIDQNHFLIIKATVSNWGNYDLIAYKAIPIRRDEKYCSVVGPTEVIYSTSGNPDYFKDPYQLQEYNNNGEIIDSNATWIIYNPFNESASDSENVSTNYTQRMIGEIEKNILRPASMYIEGAKPYGAIAQINSQRQWLQPLVIVRNAYPSGMLNQWDGKSIVSDNENGWFMSPVIAAGKKDSANTFSGVMMGDLSKSKSSNDLNQTGLFGFHQGVLSFGFKSDGFAFIGKAGSGRIEFDGTNSTIMSAGYKSGTGMKIDLINNTIHAKNGFTLETDTIYFSDTPRQSSFASSDGTVSVSAVLNLNNNFMVSSNGDLYANGAYISGEIHSDIGEIGGWIINEYSIYSGNTALYSDNYNGEERLVIGETDNQFIVKKNGTIQAVSGTLGGWKLTKNSLISQDNQVELWAYHPTDGDYRIKVGSNFWVNKNGDVFADGSIRNNNLKMLYGSIYFYNSKTSTDSGAQIAYVNGGNLSIQADSQLTLNAPKLNITCSNDQILIDGHKPYAYFA